MTYNELRDMVYAGFGIPSHYKPSFWRKVKGLMLDICSNIEEVYHNPIRGKGHFWIKGEMTIDEIIERYAKIKGVKQCYQT